MNWEVIWKGIKALVQVLLAVWSAIPAKSKERVVESVVDGFEVVIRRLYRATTTEGKGTEVVNGQ